MKTILFKTIFAKRWNYILLIITGILIVSSVFSLLVLVDYMIWIRTESFPEITEFIGIAEKTFIYTYIFFLLFIVLLLINYIKKRNDDYYLLEILGMQQRHMRLFIVIEYLTMVFSSIFGGFICGIGEAKIIKKGLIYFLNVDKNIHYSFNPFILTIVISFIIFFIGFAICDGLLSCMGKEFVLNIGRNKSEINYKSSKFIIIGLGFYFLTIVTLKSYWGKVGKIVPLGLALISMLILLISVYKMLLIKLNNSRKYYNNMLWMDKWYYKFFYKISMSYIMAALLFIVFFLFVIKAIDNYPFKGEVIYPYDIVWMANDSDKYFLESLEQNYNVEIEKQPCIRVTTPDFGEHIGISASQYKEWTGNEIALSDKEVFVIYQREREDRNMLGIDYGTKNPRIYIGKAQNDLWIRTVKTIPSAKFNTRFHIVGEMDNNITGIFENRSWGAFYGNVFECIIVFSDAYYDTVKENAQGANLVVMINIFDKYNKITDLIYSYAKMHSEKNFFDSKNLNIIYEKKI